MTAHAYGRNDANLYLLHFEICASDFDETWRQHQNWLALQVTILKNFRISYEFTVFAQKSPKRLDFGVVDQICKVAKVRVDKICISVQFQLAKFGLKIIFANPHNFLKKWSLLQKNAQTSLIPMELELASNFKTRVQESDSKFSTLASFLL